MGPPQDPPLLRGQPLPGEHLQQGQELGAVPEVLGEVADPLGRHALGQVRVDPVDERLLLNSLLLIWKKERKKRILKERLP